MSQPALHNTINYIEFTTNDIAQTKCFYERVFSWNFQEWGPDYISFDVPNAGIAGGFRKGDRHENPPDFAPLIVIYSQNLEATQLGITKEGGSIVVPTFEFPGGHRFHFSDGTGNVLAVWSEKA